MGWSHPIGWSHPMGWSHCYRGWDLDTAGVRPTEARQARDA